MIDLLRPREPEWLELGGGVAVQVRPLTSAVMLAARAELRQASADLDARIEILIKALARAAAAAGPGADNGPGSTTETLDKAAARAMGTNVRVLADWRRQLRR